MPASLITALVVTSPTPADPSLDTIDTTVRSVRAHLPESPVLIACDGVRPSQRALEGPYREKLAALEIYAEQGPICVRRLERWGHQANVTRAALRTVETPLVLFVEHDAPLLPCPIDWAGAAETVTSGELDVLRFLHESHILAEHRHMALEPAPVVSRRVPYLRTYQWSQRPHLARTAWYRDLLETYFASSSRTMIEDVMHGVCDYWHRELGEVGWRKFKLGIYADPEPTMQRSDHLDGRAGGPKGPMTFAYPGGSVPDGAPQATRSRFD